MNDFLDNVGKTLNGAARKVAKVSSDAVDLTKTSLDIKLDEIKRDNLFKGIGCAVYGSYKRGVSTAYTDDVMVLFKLIEEIESDIGEKKVKAAALKNKKYCVRCGIILDKIARYCHYCGSKQSPLSGAPGSEPCGCGCETDPCTCESETNPCACGCETDPCTCGCGTDPCTCGEKNEQE